MQPDARPEIPLPRISVIVPFYQAEETIARCIEGLLSQDLPRDHYEILMVDNNTRDRSAEIVSRHPEIRLLRETRQGAYAARNGGLGQARGDWIAFTDPDCIPANDWLRRLTSPFVEPNVEIVIGRSRLAAGSRAMRALDEYERVRDQTVFGSAEPLVYYGRNNNMAVRRRTFDSLGLYSERQRGADVVLVRRCVDRYSCDAVVYADKAEVLHLEIAALTTYFRKAFTYGRSLSLTAKEISLAGLDRHSRWRAFRETCRSGRYSPFRSALLFASLVTASLSWTLGAIFAKGSKGEPSEALID